MQETRLALATLMDQHQHGFSCLDAVRGQDGQVHDFRWVYVNPAASRLLGLASDPPDHQELRKQVGWGDEHHQRCTAVLLTGQPWVLESIQLNERWVQTTVTRIGEQLGVWFNDVTATQELKTRVTALAQRVDQLRAEGRELKALFQTVFEASPVGIAVQDRSFRYVSVNNALLDIVGQLPDQVIGQTPADLWPSFGVMLQTVLQEVLETGEPRLGNELQVLTPHGQKHLLFGCYPVHGAEGVMGIGSFVMDITGRKEAEEFQQQLIGVVSHDLRSPLQAILIGAQALERSERLDPQQQSSMKRIVRCARRMRRMIEDLSDFTRVRVGQPLAVTRHPTNIDEVCHQVRVETEASFPNRSLTYRGAGSPRGHWDGGRLVQVLTNLVTNAFKYSPPTVPVELCWWRESSATSDAADDLVVEVRNGGPPIPAEDLPRLFEPFKRGVKHDLLARTSLGLGLYIVKHLVEAHEGTVTARSTVEDGTTFAIRLPSTRAANEPLALWRGPTDAAAEQQGPV
jgi:PAS domain S-box-containing protein